ncbi:MAG TPA: hypothetical protein VHB25_17500 [Gemmatimonadaceae bacterium]|nr:hypothetical protein [Gemmatimonadaceae bacterium]
MTSSARLGRAFITILLAIYGFRLLLHPEAGSFIDAVDLPIHETGHLVFSLFGEFIQFAGGTLFQLIMPSVFVGYFLKQRDRHAASVALWWVGQNCWNISVYVRDARAQELPLVGGGEHDWNYLLGHLGQLQHDQAIGHAVWMIGVLIYLVAIAGGLWVLTDAASPAASSDAALVSGSTSDRSS